jgi:hypothetical protein
LNRIVPVKGRVVPGRDLVFEVDPPGGNRMRDTQEDEEDDADE